MFLKCLSKRSSLLNITFDSKENIFEGLYRLLSCKYIETLNEGQACEPKEIIDWCADKLAKFKVPSFVEFRAEFPKTSIGKVQKNILRDTYKDIYSKR